MNPRRSLLAVLALLFCLLGPSCTPWTVIMQAEPNPMVGQKEFGFTPLEFSSQDPDFEPEKMKKFEEDKSAMVKGHAERLRASGGRAGFSLSEGAGPYIVKTDIVAMDLGSFWTGASQISVMVEIQKPDGTVLDKITFDQRVEARGGFAFGDLASGNRVRRGAGMIADVIIDYLEERTAKK